MRKIGYLAVVIIGIGIGLYSTIKKRANASHLETGQQLFNSYCIGCHNDKKSSFIAREWLFGGNKVEIINSIKHGRVSFGMPAFSEGLNDKQIESMADYILALASQTKTTAKIEPSKISVHKSEVQTFTVDTVLSGLDVPWGLEFLPDGSLLISERDGDLLLFTSEGQLTKVSNSPNVLAAGQGGLLDLELHPNYEQNGWIYMAYSSPGTEDEKLANTAIMRARLQGNELIDNEVIFKARPETDKRHHYGCKLEFDQEGYLYFSVGDRGDRDRHPQALNNDCGKIHRIHDDGSIPDDNPFVTYEGARPSIYSYGHRNPQGVCMHPETGRIWTDEHGPKGGDEINLIEPGKNYGWPVISFGINYNGTTFTNDTAKAGMEQPVHYWVPSIAPCGMTFIKGDRYPNWKNNILTGSLRFEYLHRVVLDGDKVSHEEKLLEGIGRVRNVEMSPDGYIYVAIEKPGKILKLVPQ
ncbi:PQQ-dependent sugar dehydrogenase [Carboxylicivirga mesophila]|uniref:PQQ-dependent sugar dehydrogenase n=1 Tax=Carboxylicivirga mesophila TaxID=1166478 RepID=A0ABS5KF57_9BACT|nr:PQQ-dependent sugar dehydrogenase [Carboxylicivirga mesophila]MBS2213640.1 PQQ-dependent sugar dehydrogenase [Carboxylicivirga mesophila]